MTVERSLHLDVKDLLLSNEPFQYAHLIKFERPSRPDSGIGQVSTSKERYTYITDASRDVSFDDGSKNQSGTPNGVQNYVANKVLKVSSVGEDTEAKASSYSLVLDGNGLGALIANQNIVITQVNTTTWDIEFPTTVNLLSYGFREGDKVALSGYVNASVNISKFRAANKIRVTKIDTNLTASSGVASLELSSDEIVSILLDKNTDSYSSFVNREVFIYRAYFQNGILTGTPFLLFKGIIAGVAFDDDETGLTVTWSLTSHWGDFSQVKGRITSDDFHRALDQNGVPQPTSALKVAYAYDKGFTHAETSLHILAQYSAQVEKQDVIVKKGFLGIGSKVSVKKYYASETRTTELDFQLQAKAIPIIYGVRTTEGVPVFADTLNDNSSIVYTIQVLSEGEIGGLYDVYVEGNSLICNDKADFDARSTQTDDDNVQLICRGRADRGDVLGGVSSVSPTVAPFYDFYYSDPTSAYRNTLSSDYTWLFNYNQYVEPVTTVADNTGSGVYDGQSIYLTSPQEITLDLFSGKSGQKAAPALVAIAKANNFKIQNDYWNGIDTEDYWGPNHRLLDTAYVVGKFVIKEGETTIPTTEYVVRGKSINCYNYDKSYAHYPKATGESASNFSIGQVCQLQKVDGTILVSGVKIIDKWSFTRPDGVVETRFRFDSDPPLTYVDGVPQLTKFKMVRDGNTWTMMTYNFTEYAGVNTREWINQITAADEVNGYVRFTVSGTLGTAGGDPDEPSAAFSVVDVNGNPVANTFFEGAVVGGTISGSSITTKYSWDAAEDFATAVVGQYLVKRNIVTLPSTASPTVGEYNNYDVILTRIDTVTGKITRQRKQVVDYTGSSAKIITIDGLWDYGFHPKVGDSISLSPPYTDSRISINPAIQLMDYITSKTYGRGLDPNIDLNFQSWLDAARTCDTRSNVTILQAQNSGDPSPGDVYRYPQTGLILFQGTVLGTEDNYVEFTDVIGKLSNNWNSWKTFQLNQIVYSDGYVYKVVTAGVKPNKPVHTTGTVDGLQRVGFNELFLYKVSGAGPATMMLKTDGNPVRAQKNGVRVSGYSLYDSDGIDYWRLVGWDQHDQRYVTQHQTNIIIDTSLPLFDNVNSLLEHFGGIMRYTSGQYYLDIEQPQGVIATEDLEARNITADHIIGRIHLSDEGTRSAYNSLTAAYADPANKYESRNISFFNSEYLKADRNVPRKGTLTVPGITNYYNTRLLADRFLNKSRFGLTISFNMAPRGTILLAGQVIQLQYPRYNWENKKFRITSLVHQTDASVDIVAEEYDDSFYGLSNISKQAAAGLAGNGGIVTGLGAPRNLIASNITDDDELVLAIALKWANSPGANNQNVSTEVYSSFSSHLYLDVSSISDNTITVLQNPHQLKTGELITPMSSFNGLAKDKSYFIKTTPAPNKIILSETKDGPIVPLTSGTNLDALLRTANLIANVSVPANTYVDSFGGIEARVSKYYWVRHKVI